MRIFNRTENKSFDEIEIFLTISEAEELRARLEGLINASPGEHSHFMAEHTNEGFKKELLLVTYDKNKLEDFDERTMQLILDDK